MRSSHNTDNRNHDQRPGRPNPMNRNSGAWTKQNARPP